MSLWRPESLSMIGPFPWGSCITEDVIWPAPPRTPPSIPMARFTCLAWKKYDKRTEIFNSLAFLFITIQSKLKVNWSSNVNWKVNWKWAENYGFSCCDFSSLYQISPFPPRWTGTKKPVSESICFLGRWMSRNFIRPRLVGIFVGGCAVLQKICDLAIFHSEFFIYIKVEISLNAFSSY